MSRPKRKHSDRAPGRIGTPKNNIFEAIVKKRFETFEPSDQEFDPTDAIPGTVEKVDVMARRVEQGLPIFHEDDRRDHTEADDDD